MGTWITTYEKRLGREDERRPASTMDVCVRRSGQQAMVGEAWYWVVNRELVNRAWPHSENGRQGLLSTLAPTALAWEPALLCWCNGFLEPIALLPHTPGLSMPASSVTY